jgi:hypothetical protein
MPIWEYKIITSGPLGFASPQLLEQHLNQLGKEEWEIVHFQTRADNPLAFYGLVRRPVARDWVVEPAVAAAAPGLKSGAIPAPPEDRSVAAPDADELRAEAEQRRESLLAREESLRPLNDDRAEEEEDEPAGKGGWDAADQDEDLPTFFEAIRPHMRRNQRGPGMAASVEYLAKKFGQTEADLIAALKECSFTIPSGPKDPPIYLEYEGDLYWLNFNSRRQLWINTREKPRAAFKPAPGKPVAAEEISETGDRRSETKENQREREDSSSERSGVRDPKFEMAAAEPLPAGPALLDRLRPMMRRNRRDTGLSGSISYLARALKTPPATLETAFSALGLALPPGPGDRPVFVEIGALVYWLNQDKSGQTWINAREKERAEAAGAEAPPPVPQAELPLGATIAAEPAAAPAASPLAAVRLLLKETKRGGAAAKVGHVAKQLHKSVEALLAALVAAGLKVPEKAQEKPVFVEHAGEILWLNRNARDELWLNAKASKFAGRAADDKEAADAPAEAGVAAGVRSRRPRKKKDEAAG